MKYVLAPLADFTDAPFRLLCREGGADMAYTEMVSAAALAHGSSQTRHLLETMEGEGPVGCQLFGADEREIAAAAAEVEKVRGRFVELNLNAGCPMPRILATGAGGRLTEDPAKVHRLLVAMKENTSLPITLKTRLGPHKATPTVMELLDAAESAGAVGIAVHARSVGQKHGGPVNLEALAEVVARARIPVTGNGGVRTPEDARAMEATGVAAVMVGRAALTDPAIFARLKGVEPPWGAQGPFEAHLAHLLEFRDRLERAFPDDHVPDKDLFVALKTRTHLFRYFKGRPGAAAFRAELSRLSTLDDILAATSKVLLS